MNTEIKIKIGDKQMPIELHVEVKAKRQGRKWSKQEEKKLLAMFKNDWPYALMVAELQRTESAIKSHLQRLGLVVWDKEEQDYVKFVAPQKAKPQGPARSGKPWSHAEEELLYNRFITGHSYAEIAEMHGRTEVSITSRLRQMGLIRYDSEKKTYIKCKLK